jgi:hypothetical protein
MKKLVAAVGLGIGILLSATHVLAGSDEQTTAFQHLKLLVAVHGNESRNHGG